MPKQSFLGRLRNTTHCVLLLLLLLLLLPPHKLRNEIRKRGLRERRTFKSGQKTDNFLRKDALKVEKP
jgi:hypothetical protein